MNKKRKELKNLEIRSIILIGFSGGFRRNELVSLDYEDLEFRIRRVLKLTLRKSKTDQFGEGSLKALPYFKNSQILPSSVSLQKMVR